MAGGGGVGGWGHSAERAQGENTATHSNRLNSAYSSTTVRH